jgi:hypothetical protein
VVRVTPSQRTTERTDRRGIVRAFLGTAPALREHMLGTIDQRSLAAVTGGDGWSDYKTRVAQDYAGASSRYNAATKYDMFHGKFMPGRWADNYAGQIYNTSKMVLDAVPIVGPAITSRM